MNEKQSTTLNVILCKIRKMQLSKRISWFSKTVPNHIANDSSEFEIFFQTYSNKQTLATSFTDYLKMLAALLSKNTSKQLSKKIACKTSCDKSSITKQKMVFEFHTAFHLTIAVLDHSSLNLSVRLDPTLNDAFQRWFSIGRYVYVHCVRKD